MLIYDVKNPSVADMLEWKACEIMAELVEGLQSVLALGHHRNSAFPAFLTPTLCNIVISLSRLPLVNSYTRVPPLVSLCKLYYALTSYTLIYLPIKDEIDNILAHITAREVR